MTEHFGGAGQPMAGWYPDPAGSDDERWWTGSSWTMTTRAKVAAPGRSSVAPQAAAASPLTTTPGTVLQPGPDLLPDRPRTAIEPTFPSAPAFAGAAPTRFSSRPVTQLRMPVAPPLGWAPGGYYPPANQSSGVKRALVIVGIVVGSFFALSILAAIAIPVALNQRHHIITGELHVDSHDGCGGNAAASLDLLQAGQTLPCPEGPGGQYADIHDGTAIAVLDGNGKTIGTGQLTGGTLSGQGEQWTFTITHVPTTSFYKLEVSQRGSLSYTRAEMASRGWHLAVSAS